MQLLQLRPESGNYNQQEGSEVIAVALDGGAGRYRRDKIGASRTIAVSWTLNPQQYKYWRAFWHTITKRGSLPFLCELVGEDGLGPVSHVCYFVPGSVSMPSQVGLTYVQQATLEVRPNVVDDAANLQFITIYENGITDTLVGALSHLVNVKAPGVLGA